MNTGENVYKWTDKRIKNLIESATTQGLKDFWEKVFIKKKCIQRRDKFLKQHDDCPTGTVLEFEGVEYQKL